jgi:hypothetical protein
MKIAYGLLAASALALLACQNTTGTAPVPTGGSAGAMGEGYCETVPTNPDELEQWNELCAEAGGRR